ncbi:MAG: tRNA lysidine(34) synthetase TilS, partial [Firmicutes bacterium]|nr:tRNA lysidine(34) synthetase TilS [Bacillota bacterium]
LLRERDPLDVLALAGWSEAPEYEQRCTDWMREAIRPEHFELSPVRPLVVDCFEFPVAAEMRETSPLARLAIRRLFARAGGDPGRLSLAACERIRRFAGGTGGARLCVPGGFVLARRGPALFLGRQRIHPPLPPREIPVPGEVVLADGRRLLAEWWSGNLPKWTDVRGNEAFIDADRVVWPLFVRSRRPGDRFYPLGLGGSKKIKDVLIEAKVAREEREAVPVVVDGSGRIVWLAGWRLDDRFRVTEETKRLLHLTLRERG